MLGGTRVNQKARRPKEFVSPPGKKIDVAAANLREVDIGEKRDLLAVMRDHFGTSYVFELPAGTPPDFRTAYDQGKVLYFRRFEDRRYRDAETGEELGFLRGLQGVRLLSVKGSPAAFLARVNELVPYLKAQELPPLPARIQGVEKLAELKTSLPTPPPLPETFLGHTLYPPKPGKAPGGNSHVPFITRDIPCHTCGAVIQMRAMVTLKGGAPVSIGSNIPQNPGAKSRRIGKSWVWDCASCVSQPEKPQDKAKRRESAPAAAGLGESAASAEGGESTGKNLYPPPAPIRVRALGVLYSDKTDPFKLGYLQACLEGGLL